jgi:hypothetical protein
MTRRARLAAVIGGCAVAAALVQPAYANHPVPEGSSTPAVNMERVLLAAQLDPGRSGTGTTRGAKASVLRVERALHRKHLLARQWVDGSFGSRTKAAYASWQRRLGYSGLGANGLPGETSLTKLGLGHFHVIRVVSTGPHVTLGNGVVLNRRTNRMRIAAGNRIRQHFHCTLSVVQGSYNAGGVGASAGTHDGGGALDISVNRGCGLHHRAMVRALREVGFAAWYRPAIPGVWEHHIHAIAVSDPDLSGAAQDQVVDYYHGRDGLAGHGPDTGPKVKKVTWEQYRRAH